MVFHIWNVQTLASDEYRKKWGLPKTPRDLSRHSLLLIGTSRSRAALRLTNGAHQVVVSTAPRLLSSDPSVILSAISAHAGIGEVPMILAPNALRGGSLIPVLPEWSLAALDISLIYPRSRVLAPRVRALVDFLRTQLKTHPDLLPR